MPSAPRVRIEKEERVGVLWIENPPRNTLRLSMISDLMSRVSELEKDDSVRAVVVAGAGGLVFSSGMDMEEWAKLPPKEAQEWVTRGQDAFWALEHLTKPTVAAVAGMARGAGAELALACDIRIADETAMFSHPEADLGWMPSHGGTARLSRIVGRSNALELLLSGKALTALDALRLGIVDHLSAPGEALPEARTLAEVFSEKPRSAVKAIKRALTEGDEKPYRNRFLLESQHAVQLLWSEEYQATMAKHRKKRG
jgi:enoyl-CoA hydratase